MAGCWDSRKVREWQRRMTRFEEGDAASVQIDVAQLAMLLSGTPLRTPRRARYSRAS